MSGRDLQALFDRYVAGNERLPVDGLAFLEHGSAPVVLTITSDKRVYRGGEVLTVSVAVTNAGAARTVDAYLGLQLADGRAILYVSGGVFAPTMSPFVWTFPLADGAALGPTPVLSLALPGSVPAGTYTWLVTHTDPGNPAAIVAAGSAAITFQP